MSMNLRYKGGFYSLAGVEWDVEIYQESEVAFEVQEIALAENPLEIEWSETDKLEPVQTSKAVLSLYSDTDRQFVDLYTVVAGSVRLDVYRNGQLYWSGTLDPELYEEPFSYLDNYSVSLTFSDLAILERSNWTQKGFITFRGILQSAVTASGINISAIEQYISTQLSAGNTADILGALSFLGENFFDEDDTPMSMMEVVTEVLRPFSLRIIQKLGKLFIYDLNSVYTSINPSPVDWDSDDAAFSIDAVYNNVKVLFSPYEKTEMIRASVDKESVPTTTSYLVRTDYTRSGSTLVSPEGFNVALSETGEGVTKGEGLKFFRFTPIYSGEEKAGVAWTFNTIFSNYIYTQLIQAAATPWGSPGLAFEIPEQAYLADVGNTARGKFKIKLNLELLFDVRYNPYEQAARENEEGDWEDLNDWANISYVPIILNLCDEVGNVLYHWDNRSAYNSSSYDTTGKQSWRAGAGAWGDAYLCYYDPANRKSSTGLGGWKGNRQMIGYWRDGLPAIFTKRGEGDIIDLPPVAGWLQLQVGTGVACFDYQRKPALEIYPKTRWVMYGDAGVTLTDQYGNTIEKKDIEHSAWLNRNAKEGLEINTFVGTLKEVSPAALGQAFLTTARTAVGTFYRAGRQDLLERLLIGTVYSNYADRHVVLSGTAEILPDFGIYSDRNETGRFLLVSERQRPRDDESTIKMVDFSNDNYEGIEYA
jgi:hypothetical protein